MGALGGTALTLAILAAMGVLADRPASTASTAPAPRTTLVTVSPTGTIPSVRAVAEAALPSIVAVEVEARIGAASGSGVIYSTDGYIITNHHVIEGATAIEVIFADGLGFTGELVGSDPLTDLAVVHVDRSDLTPIALGDLSTVRIGDGAVAVGNPLGLLGGPSVTSGVISAFGRTLEVENGDVLYGLLQTDAPITRGSSGGALLDSAGRLIGITTAIGVSDVGAEGLGFAVPVNLVLSVAEDLIADGEVEHAFLGIEGSTGTQLEGGASIPIGTSISAFLPQSAAEAAGARVGDVITAVDGAPVTTLDQLISLLRLRRAEEAVIVTILRGDTTMDLTVVLGRYPQR